MHKHPLRMLRLKTYLQKVGMVVESSSTIRSFFNALFFVLKFVQNYQPSNLIHLHPALQKTILSLWLIPTLICMTHQ